MVKPIRVLVVDDSAFMRKMISSILNAEPGIEVVGTARDGKESIAKVEELKPDIVTLDVEMPVMDGVTALKEIMRINPVPVVMVSSVTQKGAEATLRCLRLGAVDFVAKPSGAISLDINLCAEELVAKVRVASLCRVHVAQSQDLPQITPHVGWTGTNPQRTCSGVLAIGSSTGGPHALERVVSRLPSDLGLPAVIVQHMPANFTAMLAERLDGVSSLRIKEAADGDLLTPGVILVAPGGKHLTFGRNRSAVIEDGPAVHGVKPSVDITFASLVPLFGSKIVGVLLTGMGRDGAQALKQIHEHGGRTLAQDEATCVVFGMPKAAKDLGAVDEMVPLERIPDAITKEVRTLHGLATAG